MLTTRELLAQVRHAQGLPSNYALARALGFSEKSIQRWNTGAHTPDDETAARLAELAGLDPDAVVAAMHAERAQSEGERQRWHRIAERLRSATAAAVALACLGFTGGPDGGAQAAPAAERVASTLLIMSTVARWIGRRLTLKIGAPAPMLRAC